MASISVDEVYSTVKILANKSGGSFTPNEFNKVAAIVSMDIFKKHRDRGYASSQSVSEALHHLITPDEALTLTSGIATTPTAKEQIISIKCATNVKIERVEFDRWDERLSSRLFLPTAAYPVYRELSATLEFNPTTITGVKISYLRKPATPVWGYTVVSGRPVYAVGSSTNFEWTEIDRDAIVNGILSYLGITIREPQLTQFAELQEQKG